MKKTHKFKIAIKLKSGEKVISVNAFTIKDIASCEEHEWEFTNGETLPSNDLEFGDFEEVEYLEFTGLYDISGNEIYEGDKFTIDDYPFFSEGFNNYVGVIEYVDDPEYMGWYYDLICISDRVRGGACGASMPDIAGLPITVVGNIYAENE